MRAFCIALIIGLLCNNVLSQNTCSVQPEETFNFKDVVLQGLVDATTRFFIRNSVASNGFSNIQEGQTYRLYELFQLRYGDSATSTSQFVAGYLDIINTNLQDDTGGNLNTLLAEVVGLIVGGETDAARSETAYLIEASMRENSILNSVNLNQLTLAERNELRSVLAMIFTNIENAVTPSQFEIYLSLNVGSTLSFAIDTTGSMASEIEAAVERVTLIIESTRNTVNMPILYVLSPFNDPSVGPVTVTSDPDVFLEALNALTASGGGDLPELALTGIQNALLFSTRRSVLFLITDAAAKDVELKSRVIALALIRKIRIISLLTNDIEGDDGFVLYDRISSSSGGLVTVTDKDSINSITELFTALTDQGQVQLLIVTNSSANSVSFVVDNTVTSFNIVLSGAGASFVTSLNITISEAETNVIPNVRVNTEGLVILQIPDAVPGTYRIDLAGDLGYRMEVLGSTVLGAWPTLFEEVNGEFVHREQPRQGNLAHLYVNAYGDLQNVALTVINLRSSEDLVLATEVLIPCGSNMGEYRTQEPIRIPNERFLIETIGLIDGISEFQRYDPCTITPLATRSTLDDIPDIIVDAGTTIQISTLLTNLGDSNNFTFDVFDPVSYADLTSPETIEVLSNSTNVIDILINVPSDAQNNFISRVTVTATSSGSNEFLFVYFNIIVRNNNTVTCPILISMPGSTITCSDFNNQGSECYLQCSPGYISNAVTMSVCQANGTWTYPELECRFVGTEMCTIAGDPHYRTFDGRFYDFQGTCIYNVVSTNLSESSDLESFTILIENERRGRNNNVAFFKRAFVTVYNQTFIFYQGRQLSVDSIIVTPPFEIGSVGFSITIEGINIVMRTRFGLEIRYNGDSNFRIFLSASYANLVTGLCGNINGDPEDEFQLIANSTEIVDENVFGNSFQVGGTEEGCSSGEDFNMQCLDESEYAEQCNILDRDCFEQCRMQVATPNIIQNCVFDLCVTDGELMLLEQAVSEYAQICQGLGIPICDWRNETGTPIICPSNSHYEQNGPGCPNTCLNPTQASRCDRQNVEDCQCDDGFVLSGTICVPLGDCGCATEGRYYMSGPSFLNVDCNVRTTCLGGVLTTEPVNCREGEICGINPLTQERACQPESVATCTGSGDPHFTTFDGRRYDFQGACNYTFSEYSSGEEFFNISVELINRNDDIRFSYVHRVRATFSFDDSYVGVELGVFDERFSQAKISNFFPETTLLVDYNSAGFTISQSGRGITLRFRDVEVFFRRNRVNLILPNRYNGQVLGMCGNYNNDPADDFILPNGTVANTVEEFIEPYSVFVGYCPFKTLPEPFVCSPNQTEMWSSNEYCGQILNATYFESCRQDIDFLVIYEDCIFDLCATNGQSEILADTLAILVEQCRTVGVNLCNWREVTNTIIPECPANSEYRGCTSACPNTCLNQFAENICGLPQVEGCECNLGFIWNEGECVPFADCGCYPPELGNVPQGFSYVDPQCTMSCECTGPGNWQCEQHTCEDPGQCLVVEGQNTCVFPTPQECIASGDPHFTTFDGLKYDFQGICNYTFVNYTGPNEFYNVAVELINRNNNNQVSFVYRVRFEFSLGQDNVLVDVGPQDDSRIRAMVYNLFDQPRIIEDYSGSELQIFRIGETVVVSVRGFVVSLDTWTVKVVLPYQFINKTLGLCGNYDGDITNEYVLANGSLSSNLNQFASSYLVQNYCPDETIPEPFMCTEEQVAIWGVQEFCGAILISDVFVNCREVLNLTSYYEDCLYDLCATEGSVQVLEEHFKLVVTQCKNTGLPLCNWREGLGLPTPECPENSFYISCNAQVPPRTCLNPTPLQMANELVNLLNTADSCQCNDGYILQEGVCVDPGQCGCYPQMLGFVPQGFSKVDSECTRRCMCMGPNNWVCEEISCSDEEQCLEVGSSYACVPPTAFCVLSGDYISTFDNFQYIFGGTCSYTAVVTTGYENIPGFTIVINKCEELEGLQSFNTIISISSTEEIPSFRFTISPAAETIQVNDHNVNSESFNSQYQIKSYLFLKVIVFNFGLSLAFTPDGSLVITLSGQLSGEVNGLCGNFDRENTNDLLVESISRDPASFGNYWRSNFGQQQCFDGENRNYSTINLSATCKRRRFFNLIQNACDSFLEGEALAVCRADVDVNWPKIACTRDLCTTSNHLAILERTIVAYSIECSRRLVLPISLFVRSDYDISIECPENSRYVRMLDPCRRTCADPNSINCRSNPYLSSLPLSEGCECDAGYMWSVGECVSANRCGCLDSVKGLYYKHGQCKMSSDCSEKCQCRGGIWHCEQSSCYENQYCGTREGVWGCHYTDQCLYDNGGCSHTCTSTQYSTETKCTCPRGYVIARGSKTCLEASAAPCGDNLAQWRDSYKEWRETFETYQDYKISGDSTELRSCNTYGGCQVYWTRWFDSDDALGCGDDESLERIQNFYPTEVCARPLAIDVRITENNGTYCSSDIIIRTRSENEGLVCDNSDQEDGVLCPNYAVRFLCRS